MDKNAVEEAGEKSELDKALAGSGTFSNLQDTEKLQSDLNEKLRHSQPEEQERNPNGPADEPQAEVMESPCRDKGEEDGKEPEAWSQDKKGESTPNFTNDKKRENAEADEQGSPRTRETLNLGEIQENFSSSMNLKSADGVKIFVEHDGCIVVDNEEKILSVNSLEEQKEAQEQKEAEDQQPASKGEGEQAVPETRLEAADVLPQEEKREYKTVQEEVEEKYRQERKERDEMDIKVRKMIEESQRSTQNTLKKLENSINQTNSTIEGVRETIKNIDAFQNQFSNAVNSMANRLSEIFTAKEGYGFYDEDKLALPEVSDIDTVAELIIARQNITLVTGSGSSVSSGIPTFRGKHALWFEGKKEMELRKFLTKSHFESFPNSVWAWVDEFRSLVHARRPSVVHHSIAMISNFCRDINVPLNLISENYDGYQREAIQAAKGPHNKGFGGFAHEEKMYLDDEEEKFNSDKPKFCSEEGIFSSDIFEISGNINFMRCTKDCEPQTITLAPAKLFGGSVLPECPLCNSLARPHVRFFDEAESEEYYRGDLAFLQSSDVDCLILIGTSLESSPLVTRIVGEAINNNALIVEINPRPVLEIGNVKQLIGEAEDITPLLCKCVEEKYRAFSHPPN